MVETSSVPLDRNATKSRAVLFAALRSRGHASIAASLGISESTFSEWLTKHGDRLCGVVSAAGLKIVPIAETTCSPAKIEALRTLALEALAAETPPRDIAFDTEV